MRVFSNLQRFVRVLRVGLACFAVAALFGGTTADAKEAPAAKRAASLLASGKAAEALAASYEALAIAPDDVALLELASQAAEKAEKKDEALWLAGIAARTALTNGTAGPVQRRLVARAGALDPLPTTDRAPLAGYGAKLLEIGNLCVKRRLYANAVDFYTRCEETPAAGAAAKELAKLYKKKKAVEAMLTSGLDVPLRATHRKSAKRIAQEDKRHATWKRAWKIKGPNYTVVTNAGYELGSAVLDAMEQINRHYREVFDHKRGGGGTARCTIRLYATREEFEIHEGERDKTTQGFYSSDNYVACFDPRSVGQRLSELWETLFHEAAHQFTSMISADKIPGWLDEGTAVYFEGTRRQGNGRVETNLVHEGRLQHLKSVFEAKQPTLKQVVSYYGDESYDVEYYPVGGYLVYFFKNYEDENCERIYAKPFRQYLDSYRSGGKHDPFERFVDFFIKKVKDSEVKTFEDFEKRFTTWALALYELQFGPAARADDLIARAEKQRAKGKREAAMDSYRWALRKRVDDPRALLGLAELHLEGKEEDAAVFRYRQLQDVAARAKAPDDPLPGMPDATAAEVVARSEEAIAKLDRVLAKAIAEGDRAFIEKVGTAAGKYAEAGFPRVAAWTLDRAVSALGGNHDLDERRMAIQTEHSVYPRLWRTVSLAPEAWMHGKTWKVGPRGLAGHGDGSHAMECLLREQPPARYRFEATLDIGDIQGEDPFVGLLFGVDDGAEWDVFGVDNDGAVDVSRALTDWVTLKDLGALTHDPSDPFKLAIEVDHGRVHFYVNGKHKHTQTYDGATLRGRLGVVVQDMAATISDLRIAH